MACKRTSVKGTYLLHTSHTSQPPTMVAIVVAHALCGLIPRANYPTTYPTWTFPPIPTRGCVVANTLRPATHTQTHTYYQPLQPCTLIRKQPTSNA